MQWDNNYQGTDGLNMNFQYNRPPVNDDSYITMNISRKNGNVSIQIGVDAPRGEPRLLSTKALATVKRIVKYVRSQAPATSNSEHGEAVRDGLIYVMRVLQVRLNQHWYATNANKSTSLEEMVGLMDLNKTDEQAEEELAGLMNGLKMTDDDKDEEMEKTEEEEAAGSDDHFLELEGTMPFESKEEAKVGREEHEQQEEEQKEAHIDVTM
ncbi:uncharacterized protein HMPREF1541_10084 [Cyphellophora europaea CBS 101466]|uniref:Uncharacterized protein n=1 Tax=Cyphellophora europaea (strain CBS 101466) TaxID=1220924 RepID=W2S954_CYPE1|nr:uncharacterized protein HMPREF1541_10084 [Cyphellophora europaea CBS 101466]ETN45207.1 hypothetical protein HMPREF1541_10084 [Cyphellophora europaea CBS 101466]